MEEEIANCVYLIDTVLGFDSRKAEKIVNGEIVKKLDLPFVDLLAKADEKAKELRSLIIREAAFICR